MRRRFDGASFAKRASAPRYNPWRGARRIGAKVIRICLRAIFNAMLGEVPGKAGPLDTATRMAKDADLAYRRQLTSLGLSASPDRDDEHLVKPVGALADVGLLEELIRIVNEAQERDAEDERRLYGPKIPEGLSFQRRRQ
jgi:hypothetical protein